MMEAWVLILYFVSGARTIDVQNEDSCVLIAKELTETLSVNGICINTFDGRVLWFNKGKQIERDYE